MFLPCGKSWVKEKERNRERSLRRNMTERLGESTLASTVLRLPKFLSLGAQTPNPYNKFPSA